MLTQEQLDFYRENGYLHVKGLFTKEEAAALRQEAHDLIDRLQKTKDVEATWGSAKEVTMTKTSLLHCHDVQFQSALLTRLLVDERLTGVAADIIGSPNVQLHHNKLFIKPPEKGSPFPMHQDRPFFPHDKDSHDCGHHPLRRRAAGEGLRARGAGLATSWGRSRTSRRVAGTCRWTSTRWSRRWRARRRQATCSSSPT